MSRIVLAVPAYTGTVHLETMRSIVADMVTLMKRGDTITIDDDSNNTDIADARATMVAKFLEGDGDELVFIDNDVSWEAGALVRLLDHPVDLVAGIYRRRVDPVLYPVRWIMDRPELQAENGLLEAAGVPGGFTRCSRAMLERMVEAYSDLTYERRDRAIVGLFDAYRIGRSKLSEDLAFCQRWRDIGGKVWIDPEINMGHVGLKNYTGHLGEWLRGR